MSNNIFFDLLKNNNLEKILQIINNNKLDDYNIQDKNGTYFINYIVALHNIDIIKALLNTNLKIDVFDSDGRTILYHPIKYQQFDTINLLLNYSKQNIGIPISSLVDINGNISLHYAINFKNEECVKLLLPSSNCMITDKNENTALHLAVMSRDINLVKIISQNKINFNSQNSSGETPLHIACRLSLFDIIEFLISKNVDMNVQEYELHATPLHYACYSGNKYAINILLDGDCNVNCQDIDGNTPIHYCIMNDRFDIINILLSHTKSSQKINLNLFNVNLMLPLHMILLKNIDNNYLCIDTLIKKTNINFQNKNGITCLHELCNTSLWKKYKSFLIEKKLDIIIQDNNNMRPIDYINSENYEEFINMCIDSYYYILTNIQKEWTNDWEKSCKNDNIKCKKNIKNRIIDLINNKKYDCFIRTYPIINNSKCINVNLDKINGMNSFIGNSIDIISGMIYLHKKYPNLGIVLSDFSYDDKTVCEFFNKNNIQIDTVLDCILMAYSLIFYKKIFYTNPQIKYIFEQQLKDNKIDMILFFIGIRKYDDLGHANILLYDKKTNSFERFEPYSWNSDQNDLDENLKQFCMKMKNNASYISPTETVGLQNIETHEFKNDFINDPEGYCVSWCFWYSEMRILYPNINREKLIKYIIQQMSIKQYKYHSVISEYSKNITDLRDKILLSCELDINIYLNNDISIDDIKKIINKINTFLSNK